MGADLSTDVGVTLSAVLWTRVGAALRTDTDLGTSGDIGLDFRTGASISTVLWTGEGLGAVLLRLQGGLPHSGVPENSTHHRTGVLIGAVVVRPGVVFKAVVRPGVVIGAPLKLSGALMRDLEPSMAPANRRTCTGSILAKSFCQGFRMGHKSSTRCGVKPCFNSRQRYTGSGSLNVRYRRQVGLPGQQNQVRYRLGQNKAYQATNRMLERSACNHTSTSDDLAASLSVSGISNLTDHR